MRPITESEIRTSFVNCSQGEAKRLAVPKDLEEQPWEHLDFLGWRDAGAPDRGYVVAERAGELVGITLKATRSAGRGFTSRGMCSLCMTTRTGGGVVLMAARRAGVAGRQGNTVGQYLCTDLACSLYVRGKKRAATDPGLDETLSVDQKTTRLLTNLTTFIDKVVG